MALHQSRYVIVLFYIIRRYGQTNAAIWPFCNKGWDYLSRMESIIPVSGAKGHNVFVTSAVTLSSQMMANQLNISDEETQELSDTVKAVRDIWVDGGLGGGDGGANDGNKIDDGRVCSVNDRGAVDDSMDIDKGPIKASLPSSSKQKYFLNTGAPQKAKANRP